MFELFNLIFSSFKFGKKYQVFRIRVQADKNTGAYLGGGAWAMAPPLWVAIIAKLHRKVSKIETWPPPFASWASGFGLEIT